MKTLIATAILMVVAGCSSTLQHEDSIVAQGGIDYFNFSNSLELYTFTILVSKECEYDWCELEHSYYGKAFIAENKIWTAKHVIESIDLSNSPDVHVLGECEIEGLQICDQEHGVGSYFYMRVGNPPAPNVRSINPNKVEMIFVSEERNYIKVFMENEVIPGDSGSPVLCADHDKVIGIVSMRGLPYEDENVESIGYIYDIRAYKEN
jgi:hypothetical protein